MDWEVDRAIRLVGPVEGLVGELTATAPDALIALWAEDVCWQAQLLDWSSHRPPWWRRQDRRKWRRQGEDLERMRDRLRRDAEVVLRLFDE